MKKTRTVKIYKAFILVVVFLFAIIIARLSYIVLSKKVDGIDLKAFAENRNTVKEKIFAERGTIYDSLGNILSVNINSYTVIAYLEESRTTDMDNPNHVVDKETTAKKLSPIINMSEEDILYLLNIEGAYQIELGPGGRGITELVKEEIEKLNLPGIDFIKSVKRYYPNGDFLSYTLGYAKTLEDGSVVGEMGVELEFDDELKGKNGSREYEGDIYGYKMAGAKENVVPAENGDNIYLTIDTNIQLFAEQALAKMEEASYLEWASVSVTNAKTGEILAVASNPSFDPNIKDITSYYDPFVSYTYEPGSTMKTFSFMSAIENKLYNEKEKYMSGSVVVDGYKISDWNGWGWGEISYDQGYMASSNVAATNLALRQGGKMLKDFYTRLGFGEKTGINLPNEEYGTLPFKVDVEVANASFGQGMTVTPVQMVQAFTSIANDGTILKPYIVKKVTDSKGNIKFENNRTEVRKVASKETIDKVKSLMWGAVNSDDPVAASTGYQTYPVITIGKTGTAQIANPNGGYLTGYYDYIRSFAALFPADDPQILVYIAASKITSMSLPQEAYRGLVEDVSSYLGITGKYIEEVNTDYQMPSLINKEVNAAKELIKDASTDIIVIGNGNVVINQYPKKGASLNSNDKVFLLTNASELYHVNINGFSKNDLEVYSKLVDVSFKCNGYGYVKDSNITNNPIVPKENIEVNLSPIYVEQKDTKKETEA